MPREMIIPLACPHCSSKGLLLKDQATYVYSYKINENGEVDWTDEEGYVSYLFYNREQIDFTQFVACENCGQQFPYSLEKDQRGVDFVILQKAVRSDLTDVSQEKVNI
jgi:DNA-directed RNA polymerase subunit RPC12/RpoP